VTGGRDCARVGEILTALAVRFSVSLFVGRAIGGCGVAHRRGRVSERFISRAKSSHLLVAQTARVGEDSQRITASAALRLLIRFAPFLLHPSYFSLS